VLSLKTGTSRVVSRAFVSSPWSSGGVRLLQAAVYAAAPAACKGCEMTAGASMPVAAVLGTAAVWLAAARQSDLLQPWLGVMLAATLLIFTTQYVSTLPHSV